MSNNEKLSLGQRALNRFTRHLNGYFPDGRFDSERIMEIRFVDECLSQVESPHTLVDLGCAYAEPRWYTMLRPHTERGICILGVDAAYPRNHRHDEFTRADIRTLPFPDGVFDTALCVSTLEHIGMDNSMYTLPKEHNVASQVGALTEIARIVTEDGIVLFTVPFGQAENQTWQLQYDISMLHQVVQESGLRIRKANFYKVTSQGWKNVGGDECGQVRYQWERWRAGAVACCVLEKNA